MSIETTGLLQALDLKTDPQAAGFVKNEADGDWLFGQTGSAWTFLETKTLVIPATTITFTGIVTSNNGWRIIWENPFDPGYTPVTDGRIFFRRNGVIASTTSIITEITPASATPVHITNTGLGHNICGVVVPPGANDGVVPFYHSGIFEYFLPPVNGDTGLDSTGGRHSYARELRNYPGIPRVVGAWSLGHETAGAAGSVMSSIDITAMQAGGLRPGSKWSLYKVVSV